MKCTCSYFFSTIGKKQLVGLTGLALSLFVLTHMLGNLLIFFGPEAYNMYSHKLVTNPILVPAELGLLAAVLIHMFIAVKLSLRNKSARPVGYAVSANGEKETSLIQKTMIHQGIVIAVFIVIHLLTFKYGTHYDYVSIKTGETMRDLFRLIVEVFQSPVYVIGYLICLVILGFHLSHGLSSAFRTLGFNHPKYDYMVRKVGLVYAVAVAVGFISQPLYVFFIYK